MIMYTYFGDSSHYVMFFASNVVMFWLKWIVIHLTAGRFMTLHWRICKMPKEKTNGKNTWTETIDKVSGHWCAQLFTGADVMLS